MINEIDIKDPRFKVIFSWENQHSFIYSYAGQEFLRYSLKTNKVFIKNNKMHCSDFLSSYQEIFEQAFNHIQKTNSIYIVPDLKPLKNKRKNK